MTSRRGAALLLVIVIIGLLAFLVTEFQRRAHLESVSAANALLLAQAQALTRSGVAAAVEILKNETQNQSDDRTELWWFGEGEESAQAVPVDNYVVSLYIEDQYGKLPVGALVDNNGKPDAARVDGLYRMIESLDLEGVDPQALTDALVDWIDDDSANDRYEYNDKYTVPNARILHLDELSRVDGFSGLKAGDFRKILSRLDARNDPSINVNTASPEVLVALHPYVILNDAQLLHDKLSDTPDTSGATTSATIPLTGRAFPVVFLSKRFRVVVQGDANGVARRAECLLEASAPGQALRVVDWMQY